MRMRGRTELPEASLILTSVKKEMKVGGILQTRTFLPPFGCEEIKVVHGEEEDKSAGTLLIPRFQEEADNDEQGPSSSNKDKSEGDDGQGGSRQTEEPMQQDQAGGEDDRASTGGTSSLDFNIFSDLENNADTLETTEPADEGISTLEPPSAFEEMKRNLPESSSPGNSRNNDQRILMESSRRRRIEASARVPFLGTLPKGEWEVHHRDHESRTGCKLDRVAFMEEVWTVIESYGTQSILKTGLNQPLMSEVLDKLDECEGRLSELLIDSATDGSEANSPIKMTPQDNEGEVVYLSRTRRGTMRSKMVIDKINAMKMKLGSRVMPRRIGKTKVDSEISMKAGNSAKRKRVEEVMDLGQGDYQLSGTDRILTDIAMVPPILMAGIKSTGYKSKRSDRFLTGVMIAIRWLEAHVRENNRQEAPTREQLRKLDCLKDLDLFETMCKVLNIPMEVKKIWARKRLMPWFRANMTAWLYEYAKKHMSKHGRVYSEYQLDIGAGAFKRSLVTHRNAVTTAVKRISRTSERSGNEKAEMLKEDLERNVTLCLHNSFCRNRESNVDPLPCCKQRVEEQKCWRTASNSVRIANDVLQDTETESAESVSQEEEMEH